MPLAFPISNGMNRFLVFLLFALFLNCGCSHAEPTTEAPKPRQNPFLETIKCPEEVLGEQSEITVMVHLPKDHEFVKQTPLHFEILKADRLVKEGDLEDPAVQLPVSFQLNEPAGTKLTLQLNLEVPYCATATPKLCKFKTIKFTQPVQVAAGGKAALRLETQL